MTEVKATKAALQIAQQAVLNLTNWAGVTNGIPKNIYGKSSTPPEIENEIENIINAVKILLKWSDNFNPQPLKSLFSYINLPEENKSQLPKDRLFWKPSVIAKENPPIPYPQKLKPDDKDFASLQEAIRQEIDFLKSDSPDWGNFSLLFLILEKFGSFISLNETSEKSENNIALVDFTSLKSPYNAPYFRAIATWIELLNR
jgi:CRISPR-associated protein Csm1